MFEGQALSKFIADELLKVLLNLSVFVTGTRNVLFYSGVNRRFVAMSQ